MTIKYLIIFIIGIIVGSIAGSLVTLLKIKEVKEPWIDPFPNDEDH